MAIMLILLLDGLWAGIKANITTYEDNVGADLYVAQPGTRNFFGAISVIPTDTVDTVRADPDVDWAVPVRGSSQSWSSTTARCPPTSSARSPASGAAPGSCTRDGPQRPTTRSRSAA